MKFCKKCQAETERYASGRCKPCTRAHNAAWKEANPDWVKAANAARHAANPGRAIAATAAWRRANPGRRKTTDAAWREANPEKVKARMAEWSALNPGAAKARMAAWRKADPEAAKAYYAAWYAENIERIKASRAAWRKANPEKARYFTAEWQKANPEMVRAHRQNRRARKRNAGGKHNAEDIQRLLHLQKGLCVVCRADLSQGYHVDHILPLAREGSNDWHNLQLLCPTCNLQKSAKHPIDFMQQKGFLL